MAATRATYAADDLGFGQVHPRPIAEPCGLVTHSISVPAMKLLPAKHDPTETVIRRGGPATIAPENFNDVPFKIVIDCDGTGGGDRHVRECGIENGDDPDWGPITDMADCRSHWAIL
jgi:hypothetical protein